MTNELVFIRIAPRRVSRPLFAALAISCAWFGGVGAALADDSVDVQVWAIRATTKNSEISPELKPLVEELKKSFKYTGYKLERRATGSAGAGKSYDGDLIGGYRISVEPDGKDGKRIKLRLGVTKTENGKAKPVLKTSATIDPGKFQVLGGWKLDGDDVLLAAVSAK
ncbi:MAG: hypothetical protein U1D55_17890 [Phycisphaerae bacterium]